MFNPSDKKKALEDWKVTNMTPILNWEIIDCLAQYPGKLIEIRIKEKTTTKQSKKQDPLKY